MPKSAVAEFYGVSVPAVDGWIRRGCPVHERTTNGRIKSLHLPDVVRWRESARESDSEDGLDPIAERARKDKEHADKLALENQARRGELVDVGEVGALWAKLASETRSRLLSIPTKAAPLVIGCARIAQAQDILETEIHDALGAIADVGPGVPASDAPASETDDQSVGGRKPKAKPGGKRRAG